MLDSKGRYISRRHEATSLAVNLLVYEVSDIATGRVGTILLTLYLNECPDIAYNHA